jgi:hypothetical protein
MLNISRPGMPTQSPPQNHTEGFDLRAALLDLNTSIALGYSGSLRSRIPLRHPSVVRPSESLFQVAKELATALAPISQLLTNTTGDAGNVLSVGGTNVLTGAVNIATAKRDLTQSLRTLLSDPEKAIQIRDTLKRTVTRLDVLLGETMLAPPQSVPRAVVSTAADVNTLSIDALRKDIERMLAAKSPRPVDGEGKPITLFGTDAEIPTFQNRWIDGDPTAYFKTHYSQYAVEGSEVIFLDEIKKIDENLYKSIIADQRNNGRKPPLPPKSARIDALAAGRFGKTEQQLRAGASIGSRLHRAAARAQQNRE